MRRAALHRPRVVVAGQAALHHDAVPGQAPHQLGIAGGRAAVADALRAQHVDGLPHVLRGRVLARVDGEAQLPEARDLVGAAEQARRVAALGPRDVEAHHAGALVEVLGLRDGLPGQDLRDVRPVLAHGDDDEADLHAVGCGARGFIPRARRGSTAAA